MQCNFNDIITKILRYLYAFQSNYLVFSTNLNPTMPKNSAHVIAPTENFDSLDRY